MIPFFILTNSALLNVNFGVKIEFISIPDNETVLVLNRTNGKDKVVALFNMSNKDVVLDLNHKELSGSYNIFENNSSIKINDQLSINLKAWSNKLYYR